MFLTTFPPFRTLTSSPPWKGEASRLLTRNFYKKELADKTVVSNMGIIGILFLLAIALPVFEIILGILIHITTKEDAGLIVILAGILGLIGIFLISAF